MNTYKFAALPSTSSVAAVVTFAVCAWFLVATGVMITEKPSQYAVQTPVARAMPVVYAAPAVAIVPEARLIIVVEARRA